MTARVRLKGTGRAIVRLTADLLIFAGVSAVLVWLWVLSDGAVYQYVQETHFASETAGANREARPQIDNPPFEPFVLSQPGRLLPNLAKRALRDPLILGRLEVPSVHLTVMVREGVDAGTLRKAVGHLPSSAWPGQPGNFVLLGHRDTFFRPLRDLARGDSLRFRTAQGSVEYIVDSIKVVPPEAVTIERPAGAISTLITCFPFNFVGQAPRRFVVRARLVGRPSVPGGEPEPEQQLHPEQQLEKEKP
jgi:sortase A